MLVSNDKYSPVNFFFFLRQHISQSLPKTHSTMRLNQHVYSGVRMCVGICVRIFDDDIRAYAYTPYLQPPTPLTDFSVSIIFFSERTTHFGDQTL